MKNTPSTPRATKKAFIGVLEFQDADKYFLVNNCAFSVFVVYYLLSFNRRPKTITMTLEEARELLGLGLKATKKEIRAAYRRAARLWHPDRAPDGAEAEYRTRMQQINAAYQKVIKFIEDYQYHLAKAEAPDDYQKWWHHRFGVGVWGPPKRESTDSPD